MIPLAISRVPDLETIDGLIEASTTVLTLYGGVLALMLVFIAIGECIERKRRSPVERMIRRRRG
jgi:hypothetical protein